MYKCDNCKAKRDIGADVYLIESASYTWLPTCIKECAELIKEREIKKLQNKIDRIKKYKIKKERW